MKLSSTNVIIRTVPHVDEAPRLIWQLFQPGENEAGEFRSPAVTPEQSNKDLEGIWMISSPSAFLY